MKTNPYLTDFYSHYDEDERLASRHGSVEFLTTMRYIEKYIRPQDRVLEIGAGTGRYSHALARQGNREPFARFPQFQWRVPAGGRARARAQAGRAPRGGLARAGERSQRVLEARAGGTL